MAILNQKTLGSNRYDPIEDTETSACDARRPRGVCGSNRYDPIEDTETF